MATQAYKALTQKNPHTVGNLNSLKIRTVTNGAIVAGGDIDNFKLVELGFNADGERTASKLTDAANPSHLIAAVERRYLGEELSEYFNGEGERARIVILDQGIRFDTSAFILDASVTTITNGDVAHFDVTADKFIIHKGAQADYATANKKFVVVNDENDLAYTLGQATVRLEVL